MNWLQNIIDKSQESSDRNRAMVQICRPDPSDYPDGDMPTEPWYTLADPETGWPVCGPFLNEYGAWETDDEARCAAKAAGYEVDVEVWDPQ